MEVLLYTILTLCALGVLSALILWFVAQKFRVEEDPRIDEVEKLLPGANCGGCGFAGCRGMADALVVREDISALFCPVGGGDCMKAVATYLGKVAPEKEPQVATVRCGGTCDKRVRTSDYNGARSCAVAASLYTGETGCAFGCLGYGDCVDACAFDAIRVNPATGLAEVDADKCTACGACVKACPRGIIELRKKWPKNRAVYVSCVSRDKGAVVMKACKAGCIACGKCAKVCPFGAITIENNLAYIDPLKCKLCRKCVNECPTGAIRLENMEPLPKDPKVPASKAATPAAGTPAAATAAPAGAKAPAAASVTGKTPAPAVPKTSDAPATPKASAASAAVTEASEAATIPGASTVSAGPGATKTSDAPATPKAPVASPAVPETSVASSTPMASAASAAVAEASEAATTPGASNVSAASAAPKVSEAPAAPNAAIRDEAATTAEAPVAKAE